MKPMDELFDETVRSMENSHRELAARVHQPKPVGDGSLFRYVERDVHQALVQKLARVISGLHAVRLLLAHGFVQEQAALQRMLDEFNVIRFGCESVWGRGSVQARP